MLTRSSERPSPVLAGSAATWPADADRRCNPCATVDVADMNDGRPWHRHLCAVVAYDISAPNGERVPRTLELVLHVCCTQADLVMFSGR
jgi:hypothetical protein